MDWGGGLADQYEHDERLVQAQRSRHFARMASRLWHAEREARAARPIRDDMPDLTLADAYAIRAEVDALRMASGAIPVGRKIGLSARELQAIAGATEPFWAYIFTSGRKEHDEVLQFSRYTHLRVEPEIAITLRNDLAGPHVTLADVADAVGLLQPSFEIIDARTSAPGFNVLDLVADSGANAGFLLGAPLPVEGVAPDALDHVAVAVVSQQDATLNRRGDASALQDGPLGCLLWLARHVLERGEPLRAGEIILTGTMAGAIPLRAGDTLRATFTGLGPKPLKLAISAQ